MPKKSNKKVIRRVSKYLFEHKLLFFFTLLLACMMTILSVIVPTLIQRVLDNIFTLGKNSNELLLNGVCWIAFIFFIKELLNSLRIRFNNKLEQKVILKLREDLHHKLLKLPISFYDQRKSGDISSRVVEDVQNVEQSWVSNQECD